MDDLDDSAKLTLEVAEAEQGKRLDHLLAKHFPDISRSRIKALIVDGKVMIDDVVIKAPAHRVETVGSAVAMQVPELYRWIWSLRTCRWRSYSKTNI